MQTWAGWERRVYWNWAVCQKTCLWTRKKSRLKKIGEIDSNVGDMFLKHELQMQLMTENMEGIMQMIAHRLDIVEKMGPRGDKNGEVDPRWKLPTFDGTSRWGNIISKRG